VHLQCQGQKLSPRGCQEHEQWRRLTTAVVGNLADFLPSTAVIRALLGATEIAAVDSVARAKKAGVENAGVDKAARRNNVGVSDREK